MTKVNRFDINEKDFQNHAQNRGFMNNYIRAISTSLLIAIFSGISILSNHHSSIIHISYQTEKAIASERSSWLTVVAEIKKELNAVLNSYRAGDYEQSKSHISEAYFGIFEDKEMEEAIRKYISAKRGFEIEEMFGNIRKGIKKRLPVSEISNRVDVLIDALKGSAKELDSLGIPVEDED